MPIDNTLVTSDRTSQESSQVRTPVNNTPQKPRPERWGVSRPSSSQTVRSGPKHLSLSENAPTQAAPNSLLNASQDSDEVGVIHSRITAMCNLYANQLNQQERHQARLVKFFDSLSSDNQKCFEMLKLHADMIDFSSRSCIYFNEELPTIKDSLDRMVDEIASVKGLLAQFEEGACKNV